jgi:ornithine cyclodeaminase/alanine dehydrogenase-like protein (mu-crystallin family)
VPLLVLSAADVHRLLPVEASIAAMREALLALAHGEVYQPLRTIIRPPGADGLLGLMPAYRASASPALGVKVVAVYPGNPARGRDAHQGAVLLLDGATGEPLALANASAVTAVRTAAVTAVATDALARPDATTLAIIGTGVQAQAHLPAIAAVRPLTRIRVAARSVDSARRFAAAQSVPVEACATVREAVAGADIVVTVTTSSSPVLSHDWLSPGAHVNAVGSSVPSARELDTATVAAAGVFVDRRESALNESGDLLLAGLGPDHVRGELGEVLAGTVPGRTADDELTVFLSLGLAIEDLATVASLYRRASDEGAGTWVDF